MTYTHETPIRDLNLPPYLTNRLWESDVRTLGQLTAKSPRFLTAIHGIGKGSVATIQARLAEVGATLSLEPPVTRRPRAKRPGLRQQCAPYMQAGETIPQAMARLHQHLQTACTKLMNDKHRDTARIEQLEKKVTEHRLGAAPYVAVGESIPAAFQRLTAEVAMVNAQRDALRQLIIQLAQQQGTAC